ncbi:Cobalamin synthase [Falsiruegeria litorea R37]|uniref:Adenosylcobinamide-GDP ribazoletransferase n=1 Tax=Falsiruegeria litorea R37 TaxID=1200284 RepID=A0A1Y5SSI7_9RHOB|nr:adenosylcobinamide-GDP ribazoletransferase [Falsiruegeria litorea]SLN47504.1 Cobalamin synthase [Falsiruegeria litorea R37]
MHKNDTSASWVWDIPLALVLLTRLPLPRLPDHVFARQAAGVWAFPVVGLVVGGLACGIGAVLLSLGLPPAAVAGVMLAVLIMTTGAMHEDGLADTADGLWGGFTRERRLEIMKDSHIGTYGVLTLFVVQLLRFTGIAGLIATGGLWSVLLAPVYSRALMPVLMCAMPNARGSGLSQSVGAPRVLTCGIGLALSIGFAVVWLGTLALWPLLISSLVVVGLALTARAKIGGQTGDILGASQQLAEVSLLLTLLALI